MSTINLINDALNNGGIFSCPQTEPEKKAKLKMNEQKIHSIQELRDNFDAEVILKKYKNGKLYKWLQQHYYETEAEAIRKIDVNSSKLLEEICKTLGVSYSHMEYMSEIEKEHFLNKQEEIKKYTDDAEILKQAHLTAMNQDELALLIDQKETLIYLCNNSFTVPITKDNMKYIGIGTVTIENAFTKVQYERAGITIENISLPETENTDTIDIAKDAAREHGYDDFGDTHSVFATKYHEALKTHPLIFYCNLPFGSSSLGKTYTSHSACYNAAKSAIQKAYDEANEYFELESKKSLAKQCTKYYSKIITDVFEEELPKLEKLCASKGKTEEYEKICKLVNKAKSKLKKTYDKELIEEAEFYKMYNLDYFIEQVDIEEFDNSVYEDDDLLGHLLESIFTDTKEYMITDLYSPISEMESDLKGRATTFYTFAHREYVKYVERIEKLLEEIGSTPTETN